MEGNKKIFFIFGLVLLLSLTFVSANIFDDLWSSFTGKIIDAPSITGAVTSGQISCPDGSAIGDVNGDGIINSEDALLTNEVVVGSRSGVGASCCLDANKDGSVTAGDALFISQIVNGQKTSPGTCNSISKCIDSDGGNDLFVPGKVTWKGNNYRDVCSSDGKTINEFYCLNGAVISGVENCPLGDSCETDPFGQGYCAPTSTGCTDSDGGNDIFVPGKVTYNGKTYSDYCTKNILTEYTCEGNKPESVSYLCGGVQGYTCLEGACVKEKNNSVSKCIDCAAPPVGCTYSGASCTTCGTLVGENGGKCRGEAIINPINNDSNCINNKNCSYLSIATLKQNYSVGEKIELTDPPERSVGGISGNFVGGKLYVNGEDSLKKITNLNKELLKISFEKISFFSKVVGLFGIGKSAEKKSKLISKSLERKKIMLKLANERPDLFLSLAFSSEQRKAFSKPISKNFEKEVEVKGTLEIIENPHLGLSKEELSRSKGGFDSFLRGGNKTYKLRFVDKSVPKEVSGIKVKISGVTLGNYLVTSSARTSAFKVDKVTAFPKRKENFGVQKIAIILTKALGTSDSDVSLLNQTMEKVNKYYEEVSYGQVSLEWDVYGWYEINNKEDFLKISDSDINFSKYSRVISVDERNCYGCAVVGMLTRNTDEGILDFSITWLRPLVFQQSNLYGVVEHELGHNFGVFHANRLICENSKPIDNFNICTTLEYGDGESIMGWNKGNMNSIHKEIVTWINGKNVIEVKSDGVYTLNSYENLSDAMVLKIPRKVDESGVAKDFYYVEYRTPTGYDSFINKTQPNNGPQVRIFEYIKNGPGYSPSQLIDMTPKSYPYNEGISLGKTFFDPKTKVKIKTLSVNSKTATVEVTLGEKSCVRKEPTLTINPSEIIITKNKTFYSNFNLTNNDEGICSNREIYYSIGKTPFGFYDLHPTTWISRSPEYPSFLTSGETLSGSIEGTGFENVDLGKYGINLTFFDVKKDVYASKNITFKIVDCSSEYSCFSYNLKKGWNFISPVFYEIEQFPQNVFQNSQGVYSYNNKYAKSKSLKVEEGYWLNNKKNETLEVIGKKINFQEYNLNNKGWFIIGAPFDLDLSNVNCVSLAYTFNKGWKYSKKVHKGEAIFIKTDGFCSFNLTKQDIGNETTTDTFGVDYPPRIPDCKLSNPPVCGNFPPNLTLPQSKIVNNGNESLNGNLKLRLQKKSSGNWFDYKVVSDVDVSIPTLSLIKLDVGVPYGWNLKNVSVKEGGKYRVYGEFSNSKGLISSNWEFDVV